MFFFWFRPGVMPMDLSFHLLLLSIPSGPAQASFFCFVLPSLHQKPHLIRHARLCWTRDPGTIQARVDPLSRLRIAYHPAVSMGFCSTNLVFLFHQKWDFSKKLRACCINSLYLAHGITSWLIKQFRKIGDFYYLLMPWLTPPLSCGR